MPGPVISGGPVLAPRLATVTGLNDPSVQPSLTKPANWVKVGGPLFGPGGPSAQDVAQGQAADCYFLSSLAELAKRDPQIIRDAIRPNPNGTYTVTFHDGGNAVQVLVDGKLPVKNGRLVYANRSRSPVLWPELIEKAFAKWKGGYPAIAHGGWGGPAIAAMTGWATNGVFTKGQTPRGLFTQIQATLQHGGAVVAGTPRPLPAGAPQGLVGGHMYSVLNVEERPGGLWLRLRNPWGTHEPGNDGQDDGTFWMRTSVLINNFNRVVFGQPGS
jgi:hypothetical protein